MENIFSTFAFAGNNLALLVISMFPLVELRGAIIFAAALNMPWYDALCFSVIGNLIPVPFLILFARSLMSLLKRIPILQNAVYMYEEKIMFKAQNMKSLTFWGLVAFVGIPLPGTGAWTGAFIAALLNMSFKKSLPAITIGVIIAGIIMTLASYGAFGILYFFT